MTRPVVHAALSAALLCLPSCGDPAAGAEPSAKNVILICLDTVRADHLGIYGYDARDTTPVLDALAARSTLFVDTSATAGWTKPSVPSFLTGTWPLQHGVYQGSSKDEAGSVSDVLPDRALTLAEALRDGGYETAAFVQNAQLRRGQGIEQGFELYADDAGDARRIRWQARDWLEERDGEQPYFLYLHLFDAHWPYKIPDAAAAQFTTEEALHRFRAADWRKLRDGINDGDRVLTDEERDELIAIYDGALRYMDEELGRLFAALERRGDLEDTVICIVSDHGEDFLERGRIGHGHGLYETLLWVPWILYRPDASSARVDAPTSLVDLFPTLLAAAGVEDPGGHVGVNRLAHPDAERLIFSEHLSPGRYLQAWRDQHRKLQRELTADAHAGPASPSLYALGTPLEVRLSPGEGGAWGASRVEPQDEEEPQCELKGLLEGGTQRGWSIAGIPVEWTEGTKLYGQLEDAAGRPRTLAAGLLVKIVGEVEAGGALVAGKLKLYEPEAKPETELRGRFGGVGDNGTWQVGGAAIRVEEGVELRDLPGAKPRLTRARVRELLEGATAEELVGWSALDLEADVRESDPRAPGAEEAELARGARALLRRALELRLWGEGDARPVNQAELDALRAIGYGH